MSMTNGKGRSRVCRHRITTLDSDFGIIVCISCATVIAEGVSWAEMPLTYAGGGGSGWVSVAKPSKITHRYVGILRGRSRKSNTPPEPPKRRGRPRKPPTPAPVGPMTEIEDSGIEDLYKMARDKGVKNVRRMTKTEICSAIGVELKPKPFKVTFTDRVSGEVLGFPSLYRASKELKVSSGSPTHFAGKPGGMMIGGTRYLVERH